VLAEQPLCVLRDEERERDSSYFPTTFRKPFAQIVGIHDRHEFGCGVQTEEERVEKSNAAINDGSLGRTRESILSKLKPEASFQPNRP
jgi:hypothetical protein